MSIIARRKADNVVVRIFKSGAKVVISRRGVYEKGGKFHLGINDSDYELLEAVELADPFTPNAYTYIDGEWALIDEALLTIPEEVSKTQFLIAVLRANHKSRLTSWYAGELEEVQIRFDNMPSFRRSSAMIERMIAEMGISSAAMDNMFVKASLIKEDD